MAGGEGAAAASRLLGALCLSAVACSQLVRGRETGADWTLEKVGHLRVSQPLLASPLGCGGRVAPSREAGKGLAACCPLDFGGGSAARPRRGSAGEGG